MLRLLAFMTLLTAGGLLFLISGGHDEADAHANGKPISKTQQEKIGPRGSVAAPVLAVTQPASPVPQNKPAPAIITTTGPTSTTPPGAGERNFLIRPTRLTSTAVASAQPAQTGSSAEPSSSAPKTLVERAPTTPAVHEPAPALRRLRA
jgi:hypothetical protein